MKRASIKDIAKLAGVSVATVSYVLNKKEGSRIGEATREKILEIAETINYIPNKMARSLKTNKSKLIGLIVADISNDFYSGMARYIEDEAMKLGYTLLIGSSDENPAKFKKLTELFSEQQVDGMIIAPVMNSDETVQKLINDQFPVVTVDRYLTHTAVAGVRVNNDEVSEEVCRFLAGKKFKEIAYVGYDTRLPHLLDRQQGFEQQSEKEKVQIQKILVGLDNIAGEVHQGLDLYFQNSNNRKAVYFSSNKLAVAGLAYFIQKNIRVPEDVSVIAFDETDAYSLFPVEIDYIQQPLDEMAKTAVKLLDDQINGQPSRKSMIFPARLIHKKSVQ
ncbi:LacI family DNA-binding transcriptional regulator [Chryseobacterium camelliae]|uniref:LacI family DNA-binding transcriptional regulator n=1 Tax=Chryseobacterium camelliae TaxID=1265445 RepID=UPI000C1CC073|nr:LacI family DNA-binding transcriptional regulator [Chryseobacterium camelliae]